MAFSRRRFLRATVGIAAGAAGIGGAIEVGRGRDSTAPRLHYRAIVVGSGYGGGVSALRLAEAGIQTVILERGRLWDTPDADGKRFSRMLPADNRAGWFTSVPPSLVTSYRGVSVEQVAKHTPHRSRSRPGSAKRLCMARIRCSAEVPSAAGR